MVISKGFDCSKERRARDLRVYRSGRKVIEEGSVYDTVWMLTSGRNLQHLGRSRGYPGSDSPGLYAGFGILKLLQSGLMPQSRTCQTEMAAGSIRVILTWASQDTPEDSAKHREMFRDFSMTAAQVAPRRRRDCAEGLNVTPCCINHPSTGTEERKQRVADVQKRYIRIIGRENEKIRRKSRGGDRR
jgi:hypothetical protein